MDDVADIVIVGGGPVGAALALALCNDGFEVTLIEARGAAQPVNDSRPLALSYGSRLILDRLGVWEALAPTAIDRIHVSQAGGFGRIALHATEARVPNLGYVIDYAQLQTALDGALQKTTLRNLRGARVTAINDLGESAGVEFHRGDSMDMIAAKLVVVADGGGFEGSANVKVVDYHQSAVTTRVGSELPHRNTAFERFTRGGPLALLPSGEEFAVVWTTDHQHAQELCDLSPTQFLLQLQRYFGKRLGAFTGGGKRLLFPLTLKYISKVIGQRTVLIGNAAQTLHPVAGQGFNLGLRDAYELSGEIVRCGRHAVGSPAMLLAYQGRRRMDRGGGLRFTDSLVRLFSNDITPLKLARGIGLTVLGCVPPAKNFVIRRMLFGARG